MEGATVGSLIDTGVIEHGRGTALGYCGKVLVDAGARVGRTSGVDDDPLTPLERYLHSGKSALLLDERGLVAHSADLVIEDGTLPAETLAALLDGSPGTSVVSITAFGRTGPCRHRPANEFTLQALCGSIAARGRATRPPVATGGDLGEFIAGTYAAVAALTLVRGQAHGIADHADVSILECMAIAHTGYASFKRSLGGVGYPLGGREVELPSISPTRDGFVALTTISREQFDAFLLMIDRADLLGDEELASKAGRYHRYDEFEGVVRAWTARHTNEEVLEIAAGFRVPAAAVTSPADLLAHEHFRERGTFVTSADGSFTQPRRPYLVSGEVQVSARPYPIADRPTRTTPDAGPADDRRLPLEGVTVLDFTNWWAGPSMASMLGSLGADVVKVESARRPDSQRLSNTAWLPPTDRWWESSYLFQAANINKRGITIDLKSEVGRDLVRRLVARVDGIVENFTPRVFDAFGFTWDALRRLNPDLLMVRMPAFGLSGPWRERTAYAQTMETLSGLATVTGYPDDRPVLPRGPCDPLAGMTAASAFVAALIARDAGREHGSLIEVAMVESVLNVAARAVIDFSADGDLPTRHGNRDPRRAPQNVYPCRGDDRWVALSVEDDGQWRRLCAVVGAALSSMDDLPLAARWERADEIDGEIARWTSTRHPDTVVELLAPTGAPTEVVADALGIVDHPQSLSRHFAETIEHPLFEGMRGITVPFRLRSRSTRPWARRRAPMLGEHSDEVLGELLGLEDGELDALRRQGVVGTTLDQAG